MNALIYGASALGRQVYNLIQSHFSNEMEILGFVDDAREPGELIVGDLEVVASSNTLRQGNAFRPGETAIIPAIGYSNMEARGQALRKILASGYQFPNLIHSAAYTENNVTLGHGNILLPGVIVDQLSVIGNFNYFDIGTKIGEESIIGDNNYFSSGATVGGSVTIGESNFFGLNTSIVNDLSIGNNNFVNAASLIHRNLADNQQVIELREQRTMTRK